MHALILADGAFPKSENRLNLLKQAPYIVCCDGAVEKLVNIGLEPQAIVGDMDSISDELKERFADRLYPSLDQETNDLTKAVDHCLVNGFNEVAILGATGLREDHTIGNIALLAEYAGKLNAVCLLTDYGRIDAVHGDLTVDDHPASRYDSRAPEMCTTRDGSHTVARFQSYKGQQVSIFCLDPTTRLTSLGLKYQVEDRCFASWWQGTLNESTGEQFSLSIDRGCLLVYRIDTI